MSYGKTIVEKILSKASGADAFAGQIVTAPVDVMFCHDGNRPLGAEVFDSYGAAKVCDPRRIIQVMDHAPSCPTESVAKMHAYMRDFSQRQGVRLYECGEGSCHQLISEKGHVKPGYIVIATDSHTCTHGAMNALATGVGVSDLTCAMITGSLWFRVPETIQVVLKGKLPKGVFAKDIILYLAGLLGANGANYQALEFCGDGVATLSVEERMTITNMVIELGGKCGIMPCDETLRAWLKDRVEGEIEGVAPDPDARYARVVEVDLGTLCPQVAKPHKVDNVCPIDQVAGTPVQHGIIGTCTNGRIEDLAVAAEILKGKRIAHGMTLTISPASKSVYIEAIRRGYIEIFLQAGATIAIPGCSGCSGGAYVGIPADGEAVITTANRNFKGRLGNANSFLYLASPATVAASALTGSIEDSRKFVG